MRILKSLVKKEFFQIVRDPSSILIAFILPFILMLIFAYAINLDNNKIKMGIVVDGEKSDITEVLSAFDGTTYLDVSYFDNRKDMEKSFVDGDIKSMLIFSNDFMRNLKMQTLPAKAQVIVDGTDPNTALFVKAYVEMTLLNYQKILKFSNGEVFKSLIDIEQTVWFNNELKSRNFILSSSIAIIMTLVGMILTALVIAREWERGTMEALLTTNATKFDIICAKYIAYYCLAIVSTVFCSVLCIGVFGVPFRGSYLIYFITSSLFILTALGQGLIISTLSANQFLAAITSVMIGFLPAIMLSGFIFEIISMPVGFRYFTYIVPARYFISIINSLFMAGNIWGIIIPQSIFLLLTGVILFLILYKITKQRLD